MAKSMWKSLSSSRFVGFNTYATLSNMMKLKRLGKNPEEYPDVKSQPHVQVALRMKQRGASAKNGDVISYIFCKGEGEESSKTTQADRAKHPDELKRAGLTMSIGTSYRTAEERIGSTALLDYEYYLSQQLLPPIERLCDSIEGTDRARLAECLGKPITVLRVRT